jgi:hypothetical protein
LDDIAQLGGAGIDDPDSPGNGRKNEIWITNRSQRNEDCPVFENCPQVLQNSERKACFPNPAWSQERQEGNIFPPEEAGDILDFVVPPDQRGAQLWRPLLRSKQDVGGHMLPNDDHGSLR